MITENDVRLMRRLLVALQVGGRESAKKVEAYLRKRKIDFILPGAQEPKMKAGFYARLEAGEVELADKFGCILLPEYADCIFLNREWRNPKTLYVRLTDRVPELGELGEIYWSPESDPQIALLNAVEKVEQPKRWYEKLLGR